MSEIKWVRDDDCIDWYEAGIDIMSVDVALKAYARREGGCVARVVVFNGYVLAECEGLADIDAAKARAVEMLREIGTAMVRAAGAKKRAAGAKKR